MFVIAVILVLAGIAAIFMSGIKRVGTAAHCAGCTFELTGIPDADCCPECGRSLVPPAARVVGRRNQKVFRLGLILILISLPFFMLRYSQVKSTSDQHKPLWWLRAEYAFVHQDDWRYFGELRRRLDTAAQTTNREQRLAKLVLDQADALGGQPNIRDAVISAYQHATPAERSKHIRKMVQQWVDDGLNKQTLGFMYLPTYLQYSTNQIDIEPLVLHLEKRRASLSQESTRFDIRQAVDFDIVGLLDVWWSGNGPGVSDEYKDRIRGDSIGVYAVAPTVLCEGEMFTFRVAPKFAGLVFDTPGWSHARIKDIRINSGRLVQDYPIEFTSKLSNPVGARSYQLDLGEFGAGSFEMEMDIQVFGSASASTSELEWSKADYTTIKHPIRIMSSEEDVDSYWASEETRQAAHEAIRVHRLDIVSVQYGNDVYDVWDLGLGIADSPVHFRHDVYIEQGDQTWSIYVGCASAVGRSEFSQSHSQYEALRLSSLEHRSGSTEIRTPVPGQPAMIRIVPSQRDTFSSHDPVWPYEILLGPFVPERKTDGDN